VDSERPTGRASAVLRHAAGRASEPPRGAPVETRRTVTVLFVDVTGSTPLGERLDPEAIRTDLLALLRRGRRDRHAATAARWRSSPATRSSPSSAIRSCTRTTRSAPSGQPRRRARRSRSSTTSSCATTGSA
jgi:hypothetical protein